MTQTAPLADGIHALLPHEKMNPLARRRRDAYAITPDAPLIRAEFGLMEGTFEEWRKKGMPTDVSQAELFSFDGSASHVCGGLGWCEGAFAPVFETKQIADRGDTEIVQDWAGRHVLYFKRRRNGFMPEYVDHPVKDQRTWIEKVKWRLDPATPVRWENLDRDMAATKAAAAQGFMIVQSIVGGYMFLRSLWGPEKLLYAFVDQPALIHDCMQTWLALAEAVTARHQQHITLDEVFLAEDICYNHGSLISPAMMQEFLFPYYQQLLTNIQRRQLDPHRRLYVQVDTDSDCPVIPLYQKAIGLDTMTPFEVASGCDVVEIGCQHPHLMMYGGIDKRILARSLAEIDRMVERILPVLRRRGGYVPCCDHAVPSEVPYANYLHFRKRCVELGG